MTSTTSDPFWSMSRHAARRARLIARNRIAHFVRRWFSAKGFVEVDPGALQASPGNETHLHGFETVLIAPDGSKRTLYLHTSPEFAMKKLLAAGETKIFSLCHVFRNREQTRLHAPEFTMLEWYRVGEPFERIGEDCAALVALAGHVARSRSFVYRGREASPFEPPERMTVREAFQRFADVDLYETMAADGTPDAAALASLASEAGLRVASDDTWSDIFSRILADRVEPNLGIGGPSIVGDYPATESALARLNLSDPRVAERFEFYCCGVELANAFHELADPDEQRKRFLADMAEQRRIYGASHPIDEDLLAALAAMPDACGAALGFDRLIMLATGSQTVEEAQWTPAGETASAGSATGGRDA